MKLIPQKVLPLDMDQWDLKCITEITPLISGRGYILAKYNKLAEFANLIDLKSYDDIDLFYKSFKRYSTRLLIHDLLLNPEGAKIQELLNYCSVKSARRILNDFCKIEFVQKTKDVYNIKSSEYVRMGDLLEWFVSFSLFREFRIPSIFNVILKGAQTGGDYDVLGNWLGKLILIEVKSAPPKGIHNPEIGSFLNRVFSLLPDLAIFLNDTHLRVKDKIVLMFEEEMIRLKGIRILKQNPIEKISEQIFHIDHYIYIMSSKKSIKSNLTVLFRDYLQYHLPVNKLILF